MSVNCLQLAVRALPCDPSRSRPCSSASRSAFGPSSSTLAKDGRRNGGNGSQCAHAEGASLGLCPRRCRAAGSSSARSGARFERGLRREQRQVAAGVAKCPCDAPSKKRGWSRDARCPSLRIDFILLRVNVGVRHARVPVFSTLKSEFSRRLVPATPCNHTECWPRLSNFIGRQRQAIYELSTS